MAFNATGPVCFFQLAMPLRLPLDLLPATQLGIDELI